MRKRTYKVFIVVLISIAVNPVQGRAEADSKRTKIDFPSGSSLVFSEPLEKSEAKIFETGWKRAVFVDGPGSQTLLFPMESFEAMSGVIFAKDYSPRISPSGKYAVLDVLRVGIVDPGPSGAAEAASRQYCPVLDTTSGCVVSMQTGELCAGEWSEKADEWGVVGYRYDATEPMIEYGFSTTNDLWSQFLQSIQLKIPAEIKEYLVGNLGVKNMMTCEPPTTSNRTSYAAIARRLRKEGDRVDATYIEQKLDGAVSDSNRLQNATVIIEKTYLYDLPNFKAKTNMYLVRDDTVKLLDRSGKDWVRIEYIKKNGAAIYKWIQSISIKRI